MIVNKIRADTDLASGVQAERLGRLFAESDQSAHLFEVQVMDGAHAVSLDGAAVTGYFIRPDDATVTIQGSALGNVAYLTLPASCYRYAGHFSLIIKVSANDVSTAIFWGDGMITRSTSDILLDPEQVVPSLDQLLAQIEAIKQATAQVNAVLPAAATAIDNANAATARANSAAGQAETDHDALEYIMGETLTSATRADTAAARAENAAEAIEQEIVPQLSIGTVREVTAGNTAATITGTAQNPVLNLDLARGLEGDGSVSTVNGIQPDSNKNVQIPVVSSGVSGLAPAPASGDSTKFLRGDGTWSTVPDAYQLPTASASTKGGVKIGAGLTMNGEVLSADVQSVPVMTGAGASAAGAAGLVPAPAAGDNEKYLRGDGTWQTVESGGGSGGFLAYAQIPQRTTTWTLNSQYGFYTAIIDVDGLTEDGVYIIALSNTEGGTGSYHAPQYVPAEREAYACIYYAEALAGGKLKLYAMSVPESDFTLAIRGT